MIKTRTWIFLIIVLLVACGTTIGIMHYQQPKSLVVEILQDGKSIKEIDLNAVDEPYTLTIEDQAGGKNTIRVEPGRICMSKADCPDLICVHRGWLSEENTAPIVCLPHKLMIQLVGTDSDLDTVAQ